MATKRLSMRQTRGILRQKFLLGRSHRDIAGSLGISVGAVGMAVSRARVAGLDWRQVETLVDDVLDARLYRRAPLPTGERPVPDCAYLHTELRKPGVTLQLLHEEYLQQHPATGYRYTQFCGIYRKPEYASNPPARPSAFAHEVTQGSTQGSLLGSQMHHLCYH